ncbi:SEC-C metal-binding domain-containing protein [Filifactor villosus]|uniref:SEC-C metal-binding domain-containing protein n=1 Tax=Filifactor villosus TaxID=29374 RepID=A0ABV9QIM7_9FIRM
MGLFKTWEKMAYEPQTQQEYETFWNEYLPKETDIYQFLLANKNEVISGTISELAQKFNIDSVTMVGFVDGINTSLVKEVDMEALEENSQISLEIDHKKLYFNMLGAKADWLFNLPEWDAILTQDERKEIKKEYNRTKTIVKEDKVGRNDPCPCGSGKKYKKCCGKEEVAE